MKTAEQIEKYGELSRHSNWAPNFRKVDSLHEAILKMERINKDALEIEEELFDAIEAAERAFEAFKAARSKALSFSFNAQRIHQQDGQQMATRINELIGYERECFDAEDIDESMVELAKQRKEEYFASTKKMMNAANDFIDENNTKTITL
jgi:hypothetical protein